MIGGLIFAITAVAFWGSLAVMLVRALLDWWRHDSDGDGFNPWTGSWR